MSNASKVRVSLLWAPLLLLGARSAMASTALVALDERTARSGAVASLAKKEAREGREIADWRWVRDVDIEGFEAMLVDAREREARFDVEGARALRKAMKKAYEQAFWPTPEMRKLMADALYDEVATSLAEGSEDTARAAAIEALTSFPEYSLDTARHPPPVQELVAKARRSLADAPLVRVTIRTGVPARIWIDGRLATEGDGTVTISVPPGSHRLRAETAEGLMPIPRSVHVPPEPIRVDLTEDLDWIGRLHLTPRPWLRCDDDCPSRLAALARVLDVSEVVGVRSDGSDGLELLRVTASGDVRTERIEQPVRNDRAPLLSGDRAAFSPLYLLPFGGAQLFQGRPRTAIVVAGVEVGLLGWHLVALWQHRQAVRKNDFAAEPALRARRNLSAALAASAVAAGIVEALAVGWFEGR